MKQETKEVLEFFAGYPTKVQAVALGLRAIVRSAMPDARECSIVPPGLSGTDLAPAMPTRSA